MHPNYVDSDSGFEAGWLLTPKNREYSTGTTSNVSAVANARPNMIVIAIGLNIAEPPHSSGIMPRTVVAVVNIIGLRRC